MNFGKIIDSQLNLTVGDILIHKMATNVEDIIKVDLIPDEGYVEERNPDKSKKFTCKQCDKVFKQKQGVKTHIAHQHKNQSLKRVNNTPGENQENKKHSKDLNEPIESDLIKFDDEASYPDDDNIENTVHSTQNDNFDLDEIFKYTANLPDVSGMENDISDQTMREMVENVENESAHLSSTRNVTDINEGLIDTTFTEDIGPDPLNMTDTLVLRTKVVNLQLEKQKCEVTINDLRNDLIKANEIIVNLTTDNDKKINVIDMHQKRISGLEDENRKNRDKLEQIQPSTKKMYAEILKLKKENHKLNEKIKLSNKNTDKTVTDDDVQVKLDKAMEYNKKMSEEIKKKNIRFKEAEEGKSALAKQLIDLQAKVNGDGESLVVKNIKLCKDIREKSTEIKTLKETNENLINDMSKMQKDMSEKNNTIASLETISTRFQKMNENLLEENKKTKVENNKTKEDINDLIVNKIVHSPHYAETNDNIEEVINNGPTETVNIKCKNLEAGFCRFMAFEGYCNYLHPTKLCVQYSKFGACTSGESCMNIHPRKVCNFWRKGSCSKGDDCLFQHPIDQFNKIKSLSKQPLQRPQQYAPNHVQQNNFLAQGLGQQNRPNMPQRHKKNPQNPQILYPQSPQPSTPTMMMLVPANPFLPEQTASPSGTFRGQQQW